MEIGKNYEIMLGALEKIIHNVIGESQDMPYHSKVLSDVYSVARKPVSGEPSEQGLGLRLVMRYSVDGKPAAQTFWFHAYHYLDVPAVLETLENSKNLKR